MTQLHEISSAALFHAGLIPIEKQKHAIQGTLNSTERETIATAIIQNTATLSGLSEEQIVKALDCASDPRGIHTTPQGKRTIAQGFAQQASSLSRIFGGLDSPAIHVISSAYVYDIIYKKHAEVKTKFDEIDNRHFTAEPEKGITEEQRRETVRQQEKHLLRVLGEHLPAIESGMRATAQRAWGEQGDSYLYVLKKLACISDSELQRRSSGRRGANRNKIAALVQEGEIEEAAFLLDQIINN